MGKTGQGSDSLYAGEYTAQLRNLYESFISSGARFAPESFAGSLEPLLGPSPDPALVVRSLVRFSEAAVSRAALFNDLVEFPVLLELLVRLFGYSPYFTDILVREPNLFRWLTAGDALVRTRTPGETREEVRRALEMFSRPPARLAALKRLHRRETLRIGTHDLLGATDLATTTRQLSELADAVLDAAVILAGAEITERLGGAPRTSFAVIGLGKLGGEELNYSSDVDVLFVFGEDGSFGTPRGTFTHLEYHHRLSERIIRIVSTLTEEGSLYRVDARLRPESGAGPLARSVEGYLQYYEERGELWERQMLIKARPVAGDRSLGERFLREIQPFVYPRTHFSHPASSAARLKARIEAALGDDSNVKLMPGGIRDIEFIAQVLQLVHGGSIPVLRERNTLRALHALAEAGLLSARESEELSAAYAFFRIVEHRLQNVLNTQTHSLPREPEELVRLARRVGLRDDRALVQEVRRHATGVRTIFSRVLTVPESVQTTEGAVETIVAIVDGTLPEERMKAILAGYAFRDLPSAVRHLRVLFGGSSIRIRPEFETRTREALRAVAGPLFDDIARTPVPDLTLTGIAQIAAAQRFPHQWFLHLAERGTRRLLVDLCSSAPRFARVLARDAALLEALHAGIESFAAGVPFDLPETTDLALFKVQHEARAGMAYALGFSTLDMLCAELTRIADTVTAQACQRVRAAARQRSFPVSVLALGKFGSRELGFDGDLDLLFLCRDARSIGRAEKFATAFLEDMTRSSAEGKLYTVDVRLRPEGRNAPLAATLDSYRKYLSVRASLWERQSLTRLRFVAGDAALGNEVEQAAKDFVYRHPLPAGWAERVVAMRRTMEPRAHFRGQAPLHLKKGAGGMVDVEFVAQMALLHAGPAALSLHGKTVTEILSGAAGGVITEQESRLLASAYRRFRDVETRMRMVLEERGAVLPDGEALYRLGRSCGSADGEALVATLDATMKDVRTVFLEVADRCGRRGTGASGT